MEGHRASIARGPKTVGVLIEKLSRRFKRRNGVVPGGYFEEFCEFQQVKPKPNRKQLN